MGKLLADLDDIYLAYERNGFTLLHIALRHLEGLSKLAMHHRDPFDHLLVAQAIAEQATFISDDRNAAQYGVSAMTCADGI